MKAANEILAAAGLPAYDRESANDTRRLNGFERLLVANGAGAESFEVRLKCGHEERSGLLLGWGKKRTIRQAIDSVLDQ